MYVCLFVSAFGIARQTPSNSHLCANSSGGICPGWQSRDAPTGDVRRGLAQPAGSEHWVWEVPSPSQKLCGALGFPCWLLSGS